MIRLAKITGLVLAASMAVGGEAQARQSDERAAMVAAIASITPSSDIPEGVVPYPDAYRSDNWLMSHYRMRTMAFSTQTALNGGVAFVGDSITEGGDWSTAFPGVTTGNYGVGGDRSEGLLYRYQQVVDAKPGRIFLLIGTNDLGNNIPPAKIAENVGKLLDLWKEALPDTQVVIQSVLPRQADYGLRINELNVLLHRTATAHGAQWLDLYPAFLAGDAIDPSVTYDNLHLNAAGYERWSKLIDACVRAGGCEAAQ